MDLPRPHSQVDSAQLQKKARALSLFCHPDKCGGDHGAYLFLVTCKEECERRMRVNDTSCHLEQARRGGRGSNKQTAAAGGAPMDRRVLSEAEFRLPGMGSYVCRPWQRHTPAG